MLCRTACLMLVVLLSALPAVAAPVPEEVQIRERLWKLYGAPVDPQKQGTFELVGNKLRIRLSASTTRFPYRLDLAPRPEREVEGDFVARVGVTYTRSLRPPVTESEPAVGGGIIVVFGELHFVYIERSHIYRPDPERAPWLGGFMSGHWRAQGYSGGGHFGGANDAGQLWHVRVTRKKDHFTTESSSDGREWTEEETFEAEAPTKVKVGLFASHNIDQPCDVIFEDYSIEKPRE